MNETHHQIQYIKPIFKNNPKNHDHFEMNVKLLYKDKLKREKKLKMADREESESASEEEEDTVMDFQK